jgi:hypothetical protein
MKLLQDYDILENFDKKLIIKWITQVKRNLKKIFN